MNDGLYTATITPTAGGNYEVNIKMTNEYTAANPSATTVVDQLSLAFSVIDETTVPSQSTLVLSPAMSEVTSGSSVTYTYASNNAGGSP